MFVNPLGGKGHGRRVYERKVAPLFALASITAEIIGKGHAAAKRVALCTLSDESSKAECWGVCIPE